MTFQEFLEKYNGKYVEAGGSSNALNQCVDLVNQYLVEVYGKDKILWTNAKDFPSKLDGDYEWIPNTPEGVPQEGDVIVWNNGDYGHIGIFIDGDVNRFRSFDQNYPIGSPAHVQGHTYRNVAGWFRLKKDDCQEVIDGLRKERDDNWNLYQEQLANNLGLKEEKKRLEEFRKTLANKLNVEDQTSSILGAVEKLIGAEDKFHSLQRDFDKVKIEKEALIQANKKCAETIEARDIHIEDLEREIEPLRGVEQARVKAVEALEKCINRQPYCSRLGRWLKLCN